ncbi:MAG TPA: hypothetical protein VF761_17025 [Gemmatimonadaceae bacterium]
MADEPNTPPAETPAHTPTAPTGDAGSAAADPAAATTDAGANTTEAIGETAPELETEADVDGPSISPSTINTRETADAISHTIPLDVATVDEIADYLDDGFAPEVRRFMNTHPGVRHMMTIAVHAQGEIVHAFDVQRDLALARDAKADTDRLDQYLRSRFALEYANGGNPVDVVIRLLDKFSPRSAAEAGLAAATGR